MRCSPFKSLYGIEPNFGAMLNVSDSPTTKANKLHQERQAYTDFLKFQLSKEQLRMKQHVDKSRTERQFQVGEQVLLKL